MFGGGETHRCLYQLNVIPREVFRGHPHHLFGIGPAELAGMDSDPQPVIPAGGDDVIAGAHRARHLDRDLARKVGVPRARVNQMLRLLKLTPEIQTSVIRLGDFLSCGKITERKLRSIVNLPIKKQGVELCKMLSSRF